MNASSRTCGEAHKLDLLSTIGRQRQVANEWCKLWDDESEERVPAMTICVAAICENTAIFAMSDRLLTAGIHQYQPARPKIYRITQSIVAMLSGDDIALAAELIQEVLVKVQVGINANPKVWWSVKDTADIWRDVYIARLGKEAETQILSPLGLTRHTFLSLNNQLSSILVDRLSNELLNFEIAETHVIFAGSDATGPHLYVARNATVKCHDAIGYAAIGIGAQHARSQFITSNHEPAAPINRTVYVTYAAKRRAEAAPGVGKDTDTFYSWAPGYGASVRDDVIDILKKTYNRMEANNARSLRNNLGKVSDEINKIVTKAVKQPDQQQIAKDEDPTTPPDNEEIGVDNDPKENEIQG